MVPTFRSGVNVMFTVLWIVRVLVIVGILMIEFVGLLGEGLLRVSRCLAIMVVDGILAEGT